MNDFPYSRAITFLILLSASAMAGVHCPDLEGKPVRQIQTAGLKRTRPEVVMRELVNQKGRSFQCAYWEVEKLRLEGLDIFAEVDLWGTVAGDSVDLTYRFSELPAFIPLVGGKKTDQEGLVIGPFISFLNLFGRDIRFETHLRTSVPEYGRSNEVLTYITSPWLMSTPLEYALLYHLVDTYNDFSDFREQSNRGAFYLKYPWSEHWKWLFQGELFYIAVEDSVASRILAGSSGNSEWAPRLGAGINYDSRDSRINTHCGQYTELIWTQTRGASSGPDFGEFLGDWRVYYNPLSKVIFHFNLLTQYRLGRVGLYDNYYAGGANSMRGYFPGELWGESEILTTAEVRYEWIRKKLFSLWNLRFFYGIQTVAGVDGANLWDGNDLDNRDWKWGGYGGIHLLLPGLERLRVEVGNGLHRVDVKVEMGLFEKSATQRWRIR